jgi:pectate lyase
LTLPCLYAVKDGFDIVTEDEKLREEVTKMFIDINIDMTIYGWLRNARIFGSGYLEWTGDNLVLRSSQNMYVKRNEHGQLMYYYQNVGGDSEDVRFDPDEIVEFTKQSF